MICEILPLVVILCLAENFLQGEELAWLRRQNEASMAGAKVAAAGEADAQVQALKASERAKTAEAAADSLRLASDQLRCVSEFQETSHI